MGILTEDMKRLIREQKLGFVATVTPDGRPNLSPKGTTTYWDDDHLIFADLHSPGTVANLRHHPAVEINVVDWFVRKGYRFKGTAQVFSEGEEFERLKDYFSRQGVFDAPRRIHNVVLVKVEHVQALISPVYDRNVSEEQVRAEWERHYNEIRPQKSGK